MNEYKIDKLQRYIKKSNLIIINNDFRIRLSNELMEKYKEGAYAQELLLIEKNIKQIKDLGIKYPANGNPIFYVYIVPNENFIELLNYPTDRSNKGGGKPVSSYDLDGFNVAYGVSSNVLEFKSSRSIMQVVNNIHELSHLVHSMFFEKDRFICEGFAEALPLYTMDYEKIFDQHKKLLKELKKEQILSAQELITIDENNKFNDKPLVDNTSCSFELSYISSYLFVRGCLEKIGEKFDMNKIESTQKFLEIVKQSRCWNQWLVFDIANEIGISQEELLNGKDIQFNIILNLD